MLVTRPKGQNLAKPYSGVIGEDMKRLVRGDRGPEILDMRGDAGKPQLPGSCYWVLNLSGSGPGENIEHVRTRGMAQNHN
jgi:hypothetical protein